MRLIHYSKNPLTEVYSRPHDMNKCGAYKTTGLWVSVEGEYDWPWWCEGEQFDLDRFGHATEIILSNDANIKYLKSANDIDAFDMEFSPTGEMDRLVYGLDWAAIRKRWHGLVIAPYIWERRLDGNARWYYAWDCASGVIWDAAAVEKLVPLGAYEIKKAPAV